MPVTLSGMELRSRLSSGLWALLWELCSGLWSWRAGDDALPWSGSAVRVGLDLPALELTG